MMVGVYPYSAVASYYGAATTRLIQLTVYKNDWETENPLSFTTVTPLAPADSVLDAN